MHVCYWRKGFVITSVCRMAARCSLAVRDSLSTSMCCLQSEFWLLRVSNFVCRASSSDSFFDNSCLSWSIYRWILNRGKVQVITYTTECFAMMPCNCVCEKKNEEAFLYQVVSESVQLLLYFHECAFLSLKMHLGLTPLHFSFIIHHLFIIDEKRSKDRWTKLWLVCAWSANASNWK